MLSIATVANQITGYEDGIAIVVYSCLLVVGRKRRWPHRIRFGVRQHLQKVKVFAILLSFTCLTLIGLNQEPLL